MNRSIDKWVGFVACGAVAFLAAACGQTDTSLGQSHTPVNGVGCETPGEEHGSCVCADDGAWLCAGQSSVTCNAVFGRGGGKLLVNVDDRCQYPECPWPLTYEGEWSNCSDGRVYGTHCDGLRCSCEVNGSAYGDGFLTPRPAELEEVNLKCGWSLRMPGDSGGGSGQGIRCLEEGELEPTTGCVCDEQRRWDCPTPGGCLMAAHWQGESAGSSPARLTLTPDGTLSLSAKLRDAGGQFDFAGTWMLDGSTFYLKSEHSGDVPGCARYGTYQLAFESCNELELSLLDDGCAPRVQALSNFVGSR